MRKYLIAAAALLASGVALAQNPTGVGWTPTMTGADVEMDGGSTPFNVYRWDDVDLFWRPVDGLTNLFIRQFSITDQPPATSRDYSVTGGSVTASNGYKFTVDTLPGVFGDVPGDHWAYNFIMEIYARGITSGCGGGNFCPDDTVTRAQMSVFLVRTINLLEVQIWALEARIEALEAQP